MNKIIISVLLAAMYLVVSGQKQGKPTYIPNAEPVIEDYLYAAITEVSNAQYREFLGELRKAGEEQKYLDNLPDTQNWHQPLAYNDPFVKYYFRHPAYDNYPVVTVSHKNARNYCEWLTGKLNTYFQHDESPINKVIVRLPTEEEWEHAARGGLKPSEIFPWGTTSLIRIHKNDKVVMQANFNNSSGYIDVVGNLSDNTQVTAPVSSYWSNGYGLYNMSGNVAEMITDTTKTKGGSWTSTGYYLTIDSEEEYKYPCPQVGFRYFVEVIELNAVERKKDITLTSDYLEKSVVEIKNSLYAAKYEVTNRLYNLFLEKLKKDPSELAKHAIDNSKWDEFTQYKYQQMYGWHPNYDMYPVVNISYESALAFCKWLTDKYNSSPNRLFEKVIFRLPSEKEWEQAANGGKDINLYPYPWGGPSIMNANGDYLCNFNPRELRYMKRDKKGNPYFDYPENDISISRNLDGGDMTVPVDSYPPNDYGLYNLSGNVAEMISEKEYCKGGSWTSISYFTQIRSREEYQGPAPTVGFRYFMEIIKK